MSTSIADSSWKKELAKPDKFGPGTWFCIHTLAANSKTYGEHMKCIWAIKVLISHLKCDECYAHATEYLLTHPLEGVYSCNHGAKGHTEAECLYKWTYDFHTTVDRRLGKPAVPYRESYEYFLERGKDSCNECHISLSLDQTVTAPGPSYYSTIGSGSTVGRH